MALIRKATVEDVPKLCELAFEIARQTYKDFLTEEKMQAWFARTPAALTDIVTNGAIFLYEQDDQEITGMSAVWFKDKAELVASHVKDQGQGIGIALHRLRCQYAIDHGYETGVGVVFAKSGNEFFWLKNGFEIVREHSNHSTGGHMKVLEGPLDNFTRDNKLQESLLRLQNRGIQLSL